MNSAPKWTLATPVAVAVYLTLILVGPGGNSSARRADLFGSLALFVLTALLCWWTSRLIVPDRSRRIIATVVLVLWWGMFGTARLLLAPRFPEMLAAPFAFLVIWTVPFMLVLWLLRGTELADQRTVNTLAIASGLLAVFQLPALRPIPDPVPAPPRAGTHFTMDRAPNRPDIYLIVLDMFGSPENMKRYYGEDLSWFVDSLTNLGFVVPAAMRTNYIHTGLVLASLLNWRPIHAELQSRGGDPWEEARRLIENAEAWALLREAGYRLAFFPSGYPGTARQSGADLILRPPDSPFMRFGQAWWINTPAELLRNAGCLGRSCAARSAFPIPVEEAPSLRWKLDQLITLADSAGPVTGFMHFMGSHEPFVFERDCTERTPWWPMIVDGPDSLEIRRAYADQIHCVATLLLSTVTRLLAHSDIPPVILLQADHGNGGIRMLELNARTVGAEAASQRQLQERLEVFAAYHLPGASNFDTQGITPTTLLPHVFNRVLGTDLPFNDTQSLWSTWQDPLELSKVHWLGDSIVVATPAPSIP